MYNGTWVYVLFAVIAAVAGFSGHAVAYTAAWKGLFAFFLILAIASFVYEYREHHTL
jgi:uncharacterized membrane protein YtjA (UPF0391 family)